MDETLPATDDLSVIEGRLQMALSEAMLTQRAVRRVRFDPVDDRIVLRCVELALQAPTASNGQNWQFVMVKEPAVKARFAVEYRRAWGLYRRVQSGVGADEQTRRILASVQWQVDHFEQIPVLLVCCLRGRPRTRFLPEPPIAETSHYGSIYPAVQNLLLAARAVGLGSALITLPLWSSTHARRILALPANVDPCCMVTLGWAKGRYGTKDRKPVGAVVHLDRYGSQPWRGTAAPTSSR